MRVQECNDEILSPEFACFSIGLSICFVSVSLSVCQSIISQSLCHLTPPPKLSCSCFSLFVCLSVCFLKVSTVNLVNVSCASLLWNGCYITPYETGKKQSVMITCLFLYFHWVNDILLELLQQAS